VPSDPDPAIKANIQATEEKVGEIQAEKDAMPGINTIETECDSLKKQINLNKEEIRECKVRGLHSIVIVA